MPRPQGIRRRAYWEAIPDIGPTFGRHHPHLPTISRLSELAATGVCHNWISSADVDG